MNIKYTAPGRGIGGDFSFSSADLFKQDRIDFRVFFDLKSGKYVLFNTARSALKWLLQYLNPNEDATFLLPSYLCPAILQPFKELNIRYDFYEVDKRLQLKTESIDQKLNHRVHGLLVIHYFGFPLGTNLLDYLNVIRGRVVLIEDCVQALLTKRDGRWLGHWGDYSIISFRKFVPVPDGAWLLSSQIFPGVTLPRRWDEFLCKRVLGMLLKEEYLKLNQVNEAGYQFYLQLLHEAEAACDAQIDITCISELTEKLLGKLDWEAIRHSRRSNYMHLASSLGDMSVIQLLFSELPEGVCPIGLPVIADSPETRNLLRKFLIQHGVYPPVHWELPLEVKEQQFPESWDLSRRILTIPIDQRYDKVDIDYISNVLRNFEKEL